ncbi:hypothetical protein J1N35_034320, partial [Gossypium stocksii]
MAKEDSDLIDVESNITVGLTTNVELKPILNESEEEPIYFLSITKKVPAEKIDEFDSFSSINSNKNQVTKTSCDVEGRKLEAIITQKMIWGLLGFGTKLFVMWISCWSKIRQHRWNQPKGL